jgi:hypothetical protein
VVTSHEGESDQVLKSIVSAPELVMPESRLPEAAGFAEYETLLLDVSQLLEQARQAAGRAVNAVMTAT